jgi:hypothetical protein
MILMIFVINGDHRLINYLNQINHANHSLGLKNIYLRYLYQIKIKLH